MTALDTHHLQPLLSPGSVALVGASRRVDTVGELMVRSLTEGGYSGGIYPVNPRYEDVHGITCYGSLEELPTCVDLAVLNLAGHRLEATMTEALSLGVKAFVVFDPCLVPGESSPTLVERLRAIAREAKTPVCGGNGMGYSNFDARCFAGMFVQPEHPPGPLTLVAHSGSVFMFANAHAPNYFNLSISAGQEIGTTVDEYMDYSLGMPTTRAIALFVETIRNPAGFRAALSKAREQEVPVVVCKVGRTQVSARQALSHTGAIAGDADAFDALLDRYGAIRADTLEQLLSTATLLASPRKPVTDGFAMFTDSGGLCGLGGDRAGALGVDFTPLTDETTQALKELMPLTTPANPLDAMILTTPAFSDTYRQAHEIMLSDPNIGLYAVDALGDDRYEIEYMTIDPALAAFSGTTKPMFIMSSYAGFPQGVMMKKCLAAGAPFVLGQDNALVAARNFLSYHARLNQSWTSACNVASDVIKGWQTTLAQTTVLGEYQSLQLLQDFEVPVVETALVESGDDAVGAAETLGFPVALKTAASDVHHKTDVDGVRLNLMDTDALRRAYDELSSRLGPRNLVSAMAPAGIEVALGMFTDPTAGPVVAIGPGGTLIEYFQERAFAIPPFDPDKAKALLGQLNFSRVLTGARGQPGVNLDRLAQAIASFSVLCATLSDSIAEIDVNPLIASTQMVVAVDGLVITHNTHDRA